MGLLSSVHYIDICQIRASGPLGGHPSYSPLAHLCPRCKDNSLTGVRNENGLEILDQLFGVHFGLVGAASQLFEVRIVFGPFGFAQFFLRELRTAKSLINFPRIMQYSDERYNGSATINDTEWGEKIDSKSQGRKREKPSLF